MKNYGIILASGTGNRFGGETPKQFVEIEGKTILEHSVEIFEISKDIDEIIIVITPEYKDRAQKLILKNQYKKVSEILGGGKTRKESSFIGVNAINDEEANVLIHDCARPLLSQKILKACIDALSSHNAAAVAIPLVDTIIETEDKKIKSIPQRDKLMRIQTPQCFRLSLIRKAHEISRQETDFTDDCGLVIKHNLSDIHIIDGDSRNIKITYPEDIYLAREIYKSKIFINNC